MQHGDAFHDRERALEDSFFHARNQELLAELKKKVNADNAKEAIRSVCDIEDDAVLEKMVAAGIGGETIVALSLAPLVLVAWADGKVDEEERRTIMSAANVDGVDSVCLEILNDWLANRPDPSLQEAWTSYISALAGLLSPAELKGLRRSVMDRAEKVAKATGGVMGLNRISTSEQAMLTALKAAFAS
jgi:hypothetical protein